MEFVASYSGGKDSILAIRRMMNKGHRLVAIVVSTKSGVDESWTHSLPKSYFEMAADVLRCEVIFTDTNVDSYEERFESALSKAKSIGAIACVFGDIDNDLHLKWNKDRCDNVGILCVHPLMFEDRRKIVDEFMDSGLVAKVVKVGSQIPDRFIGRTLDRELISELEVIDDADICGENGEYHTAVEIDSIYEVMGGDVYLDNASTSFPKAPGVSTSIEETISKYSVSISRGTFMKAYDVQSKIIDVRERLVDFFGGDKKIYQTIFSDSATSAINLALRGILKSGDSIIIDSSSHNSVYRTAKYLEDIGVNVAYYDFRTDEDHIEGISKHIDESTKIVVVNMVDNVFGSKANINKRMIDYLHSNNIMVCIDSVQAAIEMDFSISDLCADFFIFSSHIGMMSDFGTGILIGRNESIEKISPLVMGGTGSDSKNPNMPTTIPDKLEAGSVNISSILAIDKALDFIEYVGISNIIKKKHDLALYFKDEVRRKYPNKLDVHGEGSFLLLNFKDIDDSMAGFQMDIGNKIMTRVGIHCSVLSHKNRGTFPNGGIRISVGYFNNKMDMDKLINFIGEI